MSVDPRITNDAFFATLREEVLQHPAEPYFPYLGAARTLLYVPDGNVVAWIDRTLERAPVYPPAHLLLARWLRTRNPNQALLEYRLAAEQNGQQVGAEAESLVRSYEDALELVPEGKAGIDVLEALAQHVGLRLPATRWRIDAEILSREPDASAPRVRIARDLLLDFEDHAPWCDDCGRRVIDAARDAQAHADTCEPYLIEAKVRIGRGEAGAALDALAAASDRVSDRAACLRSLASLAIAAKDDARASEAIQKLSDASCSTEMECVENITSAAALEEQRGRRAQALLLYKRAAEQAPERDDLMELVAARAKSAGLHAFAADAYTKLSMRHPDNESYARLASEETSAARSLRP
jgi:tetratricopeptide (TPR) repeat protein